MSRPGLLERSFKIRVVVLTAVLIGVGAWALVVRHRETRPVDWSQPHRVTVCPLLSPGTGMAIRSRDSTATRSLSGSGAG